MSETEEWDYKLVVPGQPKPQGRPRTRIVKWKLGIEELVRNLKIRIAAIGQPNEPADWAQEIRQMNEVLAASKKKIFAVIYEDKKDKAAKLVVVRHVKDKAPKELLEGPLRVDLHFYFRRPLSHYGTGRNAGVLKHTAPTRQTTKVDRDNLDKLILDALTGIFWKNDSRVCEGWIQKRYSDNPRTEIYIKLLTEKEQNNGKGKEPRLFEE